jgi:hypothetical protein
LVAMKDAPHTMTVKSASRTAMRRGLFNFSIS